MPLSSIIVIVLRLFAINWLLTAVPLLLSASTPLLPQEHRLSAVLISYLPGALLLIFAVGLWILSAVIARTVCRGVDTSVSVGRLSRSDLYSFAFVFLGLYFILSSFADVMNWLHYLATASSLGARHDPLSQNLYQLTRPCVTLALGLIALLGAPHWTKKLVARDEKSQGV